ncbi:MAG TPA: cupin domain-containing protein [Methyloceanibacter sp.]|nr:cupin domain-containing protein [Methyloceanibacter sp.]
MKPALKTTCVVVALVALGGAGLLLAREPGEAPKVEAQQLVVQDFAGDPSKQVNVQLYTFPPGQGVPWHIHPDAHEIAYIIQGTLTFERAGEKPREIKAGQAEYLPPNIVHRGINNGTEEVKLVAVRIKPKDKPITEEVPAP